MGPTGSCASPMSNGAPPDAEQVVLCVHGLTRNARDFDFLARRLAGKGMRVVAPDLPGPRPQRVGRRTRRDYATPLYLAATAAVIARTGAGAGRLGRHLARRPRRHGDGGARPATPIRRLVLNDFGARVSGAALQRIGTYMRLKRHFDDVDELEEHFRKIHEPFGKLTDAQWRHIAEHSAVKTEEGDLPPALRSGHRRATSRGR